ncbi:sulfoxide reductase heme-binding subunit YedZ [Sulfuriferula sp. AH1]|uniref:sulfite oxidase heme-binding subunit YedZ n=1 Tax=Sulfuriferula sp. AH1 TaxID=1985873 RepID=UPI000B3B0EED|nr:protein-methionine-sulfoxide reductase heme-binding subunit MsrQ [Sulfuriferula sp. AH1]ARU30301.1 sulfoxide reductase heme-binding subunit YedZ [Sulfuriferula sp. AH1]
MPASAKQIRWFRIGIFLLGCYPLLRLIFLGFSDGLGTNPVEFITHSTGTWTLVGLMLTLTVTPLRQLTGWYSLIRVRRMLGLFSFFYACLHFITYIWLDQFFDVAAMLKDVYKRPFITVGFTAFVLLIPLALTSSNGMIRRLGAKRWQMLHRLVYVIAILGVLHYAWLVKKDLTEPLIYAGVLTVLLGWRVVHRLRKAHA